MNSAQFVLNQSPHQLVIVGNGFDLECGLKSRFTDFYEFRSRLVDQTCKELCYTSSEDLRISPITLWDFILRQRKYENWCDVEAAIKNWVVPTQGDSSFSDRLRQTIKSIHGKGLLWCSSTIMRDDCFNDNHFYEYLYLYLNIKLSESVGVMNEDWLLKFLAAELVQIENDFDKYLQKELDDNLEYLKKCQELWTAIRSDGLNEEINIQIKTSILTFNYTNPFVSQWIGAASDDVINIHGRLGENIIIGIDGQEYTSNPYALPFTKTYRVATAGTTIRNKLFYESRLGPSETYTMMIKFYGHSLGEADYSYFQSIFDSVDLYGGTTKLIFYYRPRLMDGSRESERSARTNMVTKVSNLLDKYGCTLDNKDHGKNLMHKLLLEGRLEIKRI